MSKDAHATSSGSHPFAPFPPSQSSSALWRCLLPAPRLRPIGLHRPCP